MYNPNFSIKASNETETPNKTPITITQQLSALRITHAYLLDEHGQLRAILLEREAELANAKSEREKLMDEVEGLKAEIKGEKDVLGLKKRDMGLMEREIGFLKALLVRFSSLQLLLCMTI